MSSLNNPWSNIDIKNIIEDETTGILQNLCENEYVETRIDAEKREDGVNFLGSKDVIQMDLM